MTDSYIENGTHLSAEKLSDLIGRSEFFNDFESDEMSVLKDWVKAYYVPSGSFILKEGLGDNCLCVLVDGVVDIYKETEPDKHLKIATVKPHEPIGEMGVVDGQPFSASVITSADSMILMITKSDFDILITRHPNIGVRLLRKIAAIISSRLRSTTGRLADMLSPK
ncbi:MAG: CRP/FNR family cyclic AMP-dependent transcriptional regulator [Gammaproteobacteria bacterium]|jgi:CRP/FNR family cyclic AMP-dependent transcriptional regulator